MAKDVAVIRIKYRWAGELAPIVQNLLSPGDSVTVAERVNSLVIVADPDSIQRVRGYLAEFDRPLAQVRITVRFYERRTGEDGVDISADQAERRRTNFSEHTVIATSGQSAYIVAGKQIPYQERWPDYSRRYGQGASTVAFQVVETGFDVTPTILDDKVLLRIVPRIAQGNDQNAVVRYYGAQTEVTVPFGSWVEIGGVGEHYNDVIREILSRGRNGQTTSMSMSLMVERL